MYYLDRNEFQFDLPSPCIDVLKNGSTQLLTHYSRSFERKIKSTITERLSEVFQVPEKNILLGYGCEDLLTQIVQYFVKEGDAVLVAQHAWWYYREITQQARGTVHEYPMYKTDKTFYIDMNDILQLYATLHPKLIFLANPNNPTGDGFTIDAIADVIARCPDTLFVFDEAYWGYEDEDNSHVPRFQQNLPNVIILRSFSKYFGLPGIRIGFGFVHAKHQAFIQSSQRYLGFNRLSEEMALKTLDSMDHYRNISAVLRQEKNRFYSTLRPLPGVNVYESKANFIMISIPEAAVAPLKDNLRNEAIKVRFFDEKGLENHFRVSIAKPEINTLVLQCLKNAVSSI
jgi:histidinol-phosphate aminotransferase